MYKRMLLSLFFIAVFTRIIFFIFVLKSGEESWIPFDSAQYQEVAVQLARGKGITTSDGKKNFYRLPGYPLFLSICYKIFNKSIAKTLIVQIVFASIVPALIFFLSLALFPGSTQLALLSSLLSVLNVGFVIYSGMLATEIPFLIFFIFFLIAYFLALSSQYNKKYLYFFCAGIALGIASLIRPVGVYLLLTSFLVLFFSKNFFIEKIKALIVISGGWFLIVVPWLLRNFLLTGYMFFHTLPGLHFLQYSASYVYAEVHQMSYQNARSTLLDLWRNKIKRKEKNTGRKLLEIEKCIMAEKIAKGMMLKHPFIAIKHSVKHMLKTCVAPQSSVLHYLGGRWPSYNENTTLREKLSNYIFPADVPVWMWPIFHLDLVLLLCMLLGFLLFLGTAIRKNMHTTLLMSVFPFMGVMIFVTLAYGSARLRLPIEPLLIIFSAYYWLNCFKKRESNERSVARHKT